MNKPKDSQELQTTINQIITTKKNQIIANKAPDAQYLNYSDFNDICDTIIKSWPSLTGDETAPNDIKVACEIALAVVSPSTRQRIARLKLALAAAGGVTGIGAIIGAVALALGWGAAFTTTIITIFTGAAVGEPICLTLSGLALLGIAAYFAVKSKNPHECADKAEEVLRESLKKAIESYWKTKHPEK